MTMPLRMKLIIMVLNAMVSLGLASTGLTRMILRDPLLGQGYEWSALMWIIGLVTLFLLPLELCVIKTRREY